ncbi:MAG: hypothetical protein AB1342_02105 [Pseudomonadota bacterium]
MIGGGGGVTAVPFGFTRSVEGALGPPEFGVVGGPRRSPSSGGRGGVTSRTPGEVGGVFGVVGATVDGAVGGGVGAVRAAGGGGGGGGGADF